MDQPTPDAGSAPRSEETPQPGSQASNDTGSREGSGRDYLGRIRSDPDFAIEEVRKHQSAATKAAEKIRTIESKLGEKLGQFLESGVNGDVIANAVLEYQAALQNPNFAQAVQHYRQTGEWKFTPSSASNGQSGDTTVEDDYLTDTERTLARRNDELEKKLQNLESLVSEQTRNFGTQSLTQHVGSVFADLGLTENHPKTKEVRERLIEQVQGWTNQGPAGQQALRDMQDPKRGRDTVELMVMKALGKDGFRELAREQLLREGNIRSGLATDGPSQFGTTGDEPPPEHKSILDALRDAKAHPERLSRYQG